MHTKRNMSLGDSMQQFTPCSDNIKEEMSFRSLKAHTYIAQPKKNVFIVPGTGTKNMIQCSRACSFSFISCRPKFSSQHTSDIPYFLLFQLQGNPMSGFQWLLLSCAIKPKHKHTNTANKHKYTHTDDQSKLNIIFQNTTYSCYSLLQRDTSDRKMA